MKKMTSSPDKQKILIVDDQPANIWPLSRQLQSTFEVLCVTTGIEALEIASSENPPDLILLDIVMSGMDGYDVCRKLKADERTRGIPVIFLTGRAADPEQVKGLTLGAQDYIIKPFSLPVVSARIRSVLNLKKEMERRLLLRAQLEQMNRQLEQQVRQKEIELEAARKAYDQYEEKWHSLFHTDAAKSASKRILLVDDMPENIHILVQNLQSQYDIMCTNNGAEALELAFSDQRPDLILLDIMMPDMDGYEVCSRLKANAATWDIPVIFVTALGQEIDETKSLDLGAVDFVTKPFNIPVMEARIKAALRLKEAMDQRVELTRKLEELNRNLEERVRTREAVIERAQEDLLASERKYRSIFENAMLGIFQTTPEGRFLDANPSMARLLGYESATEFISTLSDNSHQLFARPEDLDFVLRTLEQKGEISSYETQIWKKNSDTIWVMISAKAVRAENGQTLFLQGFVSDISDRKQSETQLREYREHLEALVEKRTAEIALAKDQAETKRTLAEEASRAKSDFLARMSHEIRTPINAVIGLTRIVLKSELTAQQRDYLNKVQIASDNLLEVINDILDFSKIEAGRLELAHLPFDLDKVMEQLNDLFCNRVARKDLELIFAVEPHVPRRLVGDPGRLTQIMTNLVENAIKFTDQGEIIVRVRPERPEDPRVHAVDLEFQVSDTGVGIAAQDLATLFNPFTQAEGYLTRRHEGTGLGLAICRRLVDLMGGRIWADSKPGQGSTFSFVIPLKVCEPDTSCELDLDQEPDLRGLKALVVDDNAVARDVLRDLLVSFDLNVQAVDSGRQAIEVLRQAAADEPFQLVLMDWKMPGMDGLETAAAIRNDPDLARPPVIILVTAFGQELMQERLQSTAVDDLLLKPVKPTRLFKTIQSLFGRAEFASPLVKEFKKDFGLAGRRVLLAEDNEMSRTVAVALLEEAGMRVESAENGEAAVKKVIGVQNGYYDVVLMDIQMPVMDGYTAAQRIRASDSENRDIPIIALTAHALAGEKEKCLAAGMDDYLAKPIDEKQLYTVLQKWI